MVPVIAEHIEITPGICGGKPRIAGHRIKVQHVAICHNRMGMSVEEIAATYPGLTLADIYTALAYYFDHREEIDADIKEGEKFVEQLRDGAPTIFEKARSMNAQNDPIPPG